MSNVQGSGRNITVENFFSSVPLAKELLSRDLTMIGTIRKNKVEIPLAFKHRRQEMCIPLNLVLAKKVKSCFVRMYQGKGKPLQ